MEKIKKDYSFNIILIILFFTFSFSAIGYSMSNVRYDKDNLRVPMHYRDTERDDTADAHSYRKIEVYYDEKAKIKRIAWDTIPDGLIKRLLKIIKEDAQLRSKLFILGGACRDLFYDFKPSDIDCLPLEGSWRVFAENYLTENMLFEGVEVARTFADYIGEESVRYVDGRIKYGFGSMPDLSINHMLIGFDEDSDDPFLQDNEGGLIDLMNKTAKIGDTALSPQSGDFFLQRIIAKIIKYNLAPTPETNSCILNMVRDIESKGYGQNEIRLAPKTTQTIVATYKLWYNACLSQDFNLRQSIRRQFGYTDIAEPLLVLKQGSLPVLRDAAKESL